MGVSRAWRALRLVAAFAAAVPLAACFQPVYSERASLGGATISSQLSAIDVDKVVFSGPTAERIAGELRSNLLTVFNAGSSAQINYKLKVTIGTGLQSVIVNILTARPDVENYALNASYDLIDLQTGKSVLNGQTFARVSYDIPGGQQRFARGRALRDSENRASQEVAENIRTRIAAYFVSRS